MKKHSVLTPTLMIGALAFFVAVAAPFALYGWHALSEVLSGRGGPTALVTVGTLGLIFGVLASAFGRFLLHAEDA